MSRRQPGATSRRRTRDPFPCSEGVEVAANCTSAHVWTAPEPQCMWHTLVVTVGSLCLFRCPPPQSCRWMGRWPGHLGQHQVGKLVSLTDRVDLETLI